ncbi:MAG: hypothetical protein JWQ79_2975 [Mucilaginibacter sp.]|nr:hypothetical protein [Mucilaginibacter sp.]
MGTVQIKRIYEPAEKTDGARILVDRLWPRGISKESAHLDEWMKDIAPTADLRKWFNHDVAKWYEFNLRYVLELKQNTTVKALLDIIKSHKTVTLLYAAHDEAHNHALVLQKYISEISG